MITEEDRKIAAQIARRILTAGVDMRGTYRQGDYEVTPHDFAQRPTIWCMFKRLADGDKEDLGYTKAETVAEAFRKAREVDRADPNRVPIIIGVWDADYGMRPSEP